jgi:hypothetical protein
MDLFAEANEVRLLPNKSVAGGGGTVNSDEIRLTNVSDTVYDVDAGPGALGGRNLTILLVVPFDGVGKRGCSGDGRVDRSFCIDGPSA